MRRLIPIAAFTLFLTLPVWAQRGGGHGGGGFGGHGGGFGGGQAGFGGHGSFGGGMSGGHAFGGMSSGRGFSGSHFQSRGFNRGSSFHQPFLHDGFQGNRFFGDRFRGDRFGRDRFRDFDFDDFAFGNCFGCRNWWGWGWPWWWSSGYYDPYWWWDSGYSYDYDREREIQQAEEMNAQSLEEQRARHQEDQDLYAKGQPAPWPRSTEVGEASTDPTVLVFRDQHREEVQNYAIVGQTLWDFTSRRTQKVALSELDIPATVKANEERGVDFKVPGDGQGQ